MKEGDYVDVFVDAYLNKIMSRCSNLNSLHGVFTTVIADFIKNLIGFLRCEGSPIVELHSLGSGQRRRLRGVVLGGGER